MRSLSAPGIGVASRCASGFSHPRITDSGKVAMFAPAAFAVSSAYSMRRKFPSRSPSMLRI
jgi:hypothetical protein